MAADPASLLLFEHQFTGEVEVKEGTQTAYSSTA
jgi:hypothetical protein